MSTLIMNTFERRLVHSVEHSEEIHSGHYMVSNLDDSESEIEEPDNFFLDESSKDAMETSSSKDKNWLEFEDLASLFHYLEIAYTGQLTSPKWNQFRGLRFAVKNKIRLNNIIWREYHMQYVKKVKPYIVQFQAPLTENHAKPEAIVMEGKYWKRRISTVCQEYRSWRLFGKNKMHGPFQKHISACVDDLLGPPTYSFQKAQDDFAGSLALGENEDCTFSPTTLLEDIMMDFDENLDLFFEQPLTFPNPKDLALLGIGDIMQPGLLQFEPNNNSPPEAINAQFSSTSATQPKPGKREIPKTRVHPSNDGSVQRMDTPVNSTTNSNESKMFMPGTVINSDCTMKIVSESTGKLRFIKPQTSCESLKPQLSHNSPIQTPNTANFSQLSRAICDTRKRCTDTTPMLLQEQMECNTNRNFSVKHSFGQQHGSVNRRPHTVKHFPVPVSHRHRNSISSVGLSSDKTLKQIFRNGYMDSSVVDASPMDSASNSPALLTALLHEPEAQKKPNAATFETISRQPEDGRNNCSVPLLCSALTAPLSTQTTRPGPMSAFSRPSDFLKGRHEAVEGQRYTLVGAPPSLITNSLRPSDDVRNVSLVDCTTGGFKLDSNDRATFSTCAVPPSQEAYPGSILKSTLTAPPRPIPSGPLTPPMPSLQHTRVNEPSSNEPFFKVCTYNEMPSATSSRYTTNSDSCAAKAPTDVLTNSLHTPFKPNNGKPIEPGVLSSHGVRFLPDLDGQNFVPDTQSNRLSSAATNPPSMEKRLSSVNPPGFPHPSFSAYPSMSSMCEGRQRTSSANQTFNFTTTTALSSSSTTTSTTSTNSLPVTHGPWNELNIRSHPPALDSKNWDRNALKVQQQGGFFLSSNAPDQILVINKEEIDAQTVNFQTNSPQASPFFSSSRGRSSSAGNLFPQPQPLPPYTMKPSSSTTVSSYDSTEVLSPPISSQSNFLCTSSPSCSPPPASSQFDSEMSTRAVSTGNSSEEIRRQSMHAALQTLRRLVHLHSTLDGPAGGSRLATRRRMETHEYRTSLLGSGPRLIDDMEDELYPTSMHPRSAGAGDPGLTDSYTVGTSESGNSYRATKAATLRRAAELIREMRDRRSALDSQLNSLKNEMESLKKAINTWCGKLTPSGSTSTRPASDPYLHNRSKEWFRYYVRKRTERCWKFYVYSLILTELFQSYCGTVNTTSRDHFVRSLFGWLDQHGSLVHLRLAAPRAMCRLSTTTSILRDPSQLPEQSRRAAAEMTTIGMDVPMQMHVDSSEKSGFDTFNTDKIST